MATVVLQVSDESLVSKVKNACKMLVGVTSVRVQKSTPKVDDITKTAHYKEAMDDVKNGRVYTPIVSMKCLIKFLANVQRNRPYCAL